MAGTVSALAGADAEAYDRLSWNPAPALTKTNFIRKRRNRPR